MANRKQAGTARLVGTNPGTPPQGCDHRRGRSGDDDPRASAEKKYIFSPTQPGVRQ
jgi:hypothetical protein